MHQYLRLLLAVAVAPMGSQAQAQGAGETAVYVATYIEVTPTATSQGAALLKQYRDATRKDVGNQRVEIVQEINRSNRFAILTIWTDQKAFETHGKAAHTVEFRDKLKAIHTAPYDERVHTGMVVGANDAARGGAL